ncbi:MAG: excinuclease ABC subunit UvrC [Cyclobacteriaceae bacterium]|jgi:excinuclease ABC subunit C
MPTPPHLKNSLEVLPHQPGVYKFYNVEKDLIYVGKAKDLRKRVSSYFTKSTGHNRKTHRLVSEIQSLDYVIVNSEFDALLLENNLIKENQPKYNILLKDDKSFPHILITNERFPRIFSTRRIIKGKGEYFGPYASVKAMNNVLELIRKIHNVRTCKLDLTKKNIDAGKFKVCLEYHIGNCLGPCENLQSVEDYSEDIQQAKYILKGNLSLVRNHYRAKMATAAKELRFELAEVYKNKLDTLDKFQAKSLIVNNKLTDVDVFTIKSEEKRAFINYLKIINGMINAMETFEVSKKLDETNDDILSLVIFHAREKYKSKNNLVLTNLSLESWDPAITITKPKIGDKKKLLDLSLKNLLQYKKDRIDIISNKTNHVDRILNQMQSDLKLTARPERIECFDNSNIQGTNPVASMVCFINTKPAKKEYRHYKIRTVTGPDDFASMKEIVLRRYTKFIAEALDLPDLIVIDGGKGQLNAALEALAELNLIGKVPVIGIAKRLEEIYYPGDQFPLYINKKSETLRILQHIRDEAHRFAITFHRDLRSKGSLTSELDKIGGIGPKTREQLQSHFNGTSQIKKASITELSQIVGLAKAKKIVEYWHKKGD